MKHAKIARAYWPIVESMSESDMRNAYFGGSNLVGEYLNDHGASASNKLIGDWLDDNLNKPGCPDIGAQELIENPDYLLQRCASEFVSALAWMFDGNGDYAEWLLRNASTWFDAWGSFYVYGNADNACMFIIRAQNESDAYDELTTRFESAFAIDESDADEDSPRNDNGTPINTDYLVCFGTIKGQ